MPIVIDRLGSSMWMTGSGRGSSGSVSVSPIVISGMPAMAMISPGPDLVGRHPVELLGDVQLGDLGPLDGAVGAAPGHGLALAQRAVDRMRHSARRPRYGDASRLVTSACSGASGS